MPQNTPSDLNALNVKLHKAQSAYNKKHHIDTPEENNSDSRHGWAQAVKYTSEFGGAVLVGAFLGYGIDSFLHISPLGLLTGLALGFMAGTRNMIRLAQRYESSDTDLNQ